jgi:hypothetical protein
MPAFGYRFSSPGTYHENIFWPNKAGIKLLAAGSISGTIIDGNGTSSVFQFWIWRAFTG